MNWKLMSWAGAAAAMLLMATLPAEAGHRHRRHACCNTGYSHYAAPVSCCAPVATGCTTGYGGPGYGGSGYGAPAMGGCSTCVPGGGAMYGAPAGGGYGPPPQGGYGPPPQGGGYGPPPGTYQQAPPPPGGQGGQQPPPPPQGGTSA